MDNLESAIQQIITEEDFVTTALRIFDYQYSNVSVYREFVDIIGIPKPTQLSEIPFLPITFFKTHQIIAKNRTPELHFMSSGTEGIRSNHWVVKKQNYISSFNETYDRFIGNPNDQVILALLPNYLEQGNSSLVFMVDHLIKRTQNSFSGFFLDDLYGLISAYHDALSSGKKVVIFGVSYALQDLADLKPDLSQATILETGGMKGRRKELTKLELHNYLKNGLNCQAISSEYGMSELLSQAYSINSTIFQPGKTMRVMIREINDPFTYIENGKTGGINVIDLANIHSCSFIETQDLGRKSEGGFEILGRFDHSDLRGCNLMVE